MAKRIVVADASPLIGLASAGAFDLLRQLYGQITITDIVRDEVLSGGPLPGALEENNFRLSRTVVRAVLDEVSED